MNNAEEFLEQDKYISESEYEQFLKQNNSDISKEELKKHNANFVCQKLIEYKNYFDSIFEKSSSRIKLDEEQRRIILNDDDYCLINAGAGTGKSTTIAAKAKYLIDKLRVNPKEIIMLSFTKKSSEDLDEKVNDDMNLGIPISTFHSLGYKFIRMEKPGKIKVAAEEEKREIIEKYVRQLFNNKEKLIRLCELFKITKYNKNGFAKGFVENAPKYDSFDDYFKDYKNRKYKKECIKKGGIVKYINNILRSKSNMRTINGETCKSIGEVKIANFLSIYDIDYEYERTFEERVDEDRTYHPDFTIEYGGKKIYIEYFGMSDCFYNNRIIEKRIKKYNRNRIKKEKFQKQHPEYDFVNLDRDNPDKDIIETLKNELQKRDIQLQRLDVNVIFDKIINSKICAEFYRFIDFTTRFISILKNMLVDDVNDKNGIDYIFDKRKNQILSQSIRERCFSNDNREEARLRIEALDLLKEIYYFYENELTKNDLVDYDDMINKSYKYIIKNLSEHNCNLKYKYVIVDEYQDITFQRFLFVKRIVEYFNAKLIAVGDDWQSIYSFNGSRLELFNKFSELYKARIDDFLLSTTYRYGQDLADISGEFLSANSEQTKKKIHSNKNLENPIEFVNYEYDQFESVFKLVERIYKQKNDAFILLLARRNKALNDLKHSKHFSPGIGDAIICQEYPNANIEAITMHRSKGLTADQVIVFDLSERVFPSKGKMDSWIFEYFRLDTIFDFSIDGQDYHFIREKYPYAEERRLFYVALTRTKNKVFLVIPSEHKHASSFIKELENIIIR